MEIVGISDVNGTQDFFGGIPYAEPPLGDLRLRPPQMKTEWEEETFNATSLLNAMCLQDVSFLGSHGFEIQSLKTGCYDTRLEPSCHGLDIWRRVSDK